jgi:glutamate-1-semialdehyde 2,1-aminomutase
MPSILDEYIRRHPRSARLYEEAKAVFPSGVTHDSRYLTPFPVAMDRATGSRKWDLDGNEYVDYVSGHGALILGHSHPEIVAAVKKQMDRGTHLGGSTELEVRWGRSVQRLLPSAERIRFHSSGTEAVMMAIRLARAYTGKDVIVKFDRHFHGWYDDVTQGARTQKSSGVTSDAIHSVLLLPEVEPAALDAALASRADVAAVILEPTGAKMGTYPVRRESLQALREITARRGVLLILDEVVTGFRVSRGGAQELYGVRPDLTVLAKILGGGLPGGAVAGRADIVDMMSFHEETVWDTSRRVAHQGTFNANPLSAAAGIRCLEIVASQDTNAAADRAALRLRDGLNAAFRRTGVAGAAYGQSSLIRVLLGVRCNGDPLDCGLSSAEITRGMEPALGRTYRQAMMNHGVDVMNGNLFIVSAVHGDADIDRTVDACEQSLRAMRAEGAL